MTICDVFIRILKLFCLAYFIILIYNQVYISNTVIETSSWESDKQPRIEILEYFEDLNEDFEAELEMMTSSIIDKTPYLSPGEIEYLFGDLNLKTVSVNQVMTH